MGNDWLEYKLADLCDSIDYGFTTSAKNKPVGPKFLRITDIVSGYINWNDVPYCDSDQTNMEKYLLYDKDIVIARTGANTGSSMFISAPPKAVFASYLVRLQVSKKAESRFVSFFLKSSVFWTYMRGVLGDKSAQPNASAKTMTQVKLKLPPLPEQRAIAHILGSLDDKIEMNRRMNQTLEAMARAIFKSWFVDFDPVVYNAVQAGNPVPERFAQTAARYRNGAPCPVPDDIARLFPNSFRDSELGEIPKGWEVKSLDQIANYLNGLACQKYPPKKGEDSLPVIKIRELRQGISENTDIATSNVPACYIVRDGDVLFSWSGSLIIDIWTQGKGVLNQHLFKVTSDTYPKWFYYYWTEFHLIEFQRVAAYKATTMGHIKRQNLTDAKCTVSNNELMKIVDEKMSSLLTLRINNELEIRNLAVLRDTLLPKLISGELRIPDAEKFVEEAGV
jgi:type I restriction enzyme S subunit